jgi:hypothetical protein
MNLASINRDEDLNEICKMISKESYWKEKLKDSFKGEGQ